MIIYFINKIVTLSAIMKGKKPTAFAAEFVY